MKGADYYVVGRETSNGIVFLQTFVDGGMLSRHWGALEYADRYYMLGDAKRAAKNAPTRFESDEPATVWRVEVVVTKETT